MECDCRLAAVPTSVELWKLRLKCAIMKDHVKEVNQVFKQGILQLKEKSAPLWVMTLRYHTLTSGNEVLELIFKDGVEQPKEVSDVLKPEYIEWLALSKGMKETRKAYFMLAEKKPYCKELHASMLKLESLEMDQDIEVMESALRFACEQFGVEDVDVWINFIEFYLRHHKTLEKEKGAFDVNEKVLEIHRQAERTLGGCNDGLLLSDFREKYDAVRNSTEI
ncbi:hypothetical protein NQ315_000911 [Exocentrus adspersus]|uniref:U3 small nucleolar RNA-associated protein 6 homolog C-terminal domain-containing protein n=1 Tax=Exocentrus adspersus TaxID=1586481 RepID=A0AAV8WDU5_9CUCU|nr:hypothetical protein NQ315_000911 [Exocentrus adspersus]